jgi:hypothetical protein
MITISLWTEFSFQQCKTQLSLSKLGFIWLRYTEANWGASRHGTGVQWFPAILPFGPPSSPLPPSDYQMATEFQVPCLLARQGQSNKKEMLPQLCKPLFFKRKKF